MTERSDLPVNPGVEPGLRLSGALWVEFAADCIGKVRKGLAIAIPSVLIGAAVSLAPEFVHPSPEASQALPSMDVIPSCYTYAGLLEDADLEPHEAKLPAEQKTTPQSLTEPFTFQISGASTSFPLHHLHQA